jgi:site-specific DNA-methyltransferase (adenine-specific)
VDAIEGFLVTTMIYPQDFHNRIICGDCLQIMKDIPDASIDCVVTSPPYNLNIRKTFGNTDKWAGKWNKSKLQAQGYDQHNDYMPEDQYLTWQHQVLLECFRIIKDTGAIYYNHKWRVQNGLLQQRPEIVQGLPVRQIIIWQKAGGINFNEGYFLPTYEVIYLIAKPDFKLAPKANRFKDVWSITQEKGSWHPAPFPLELAKRCVESQTGNLILDPFAGSATVAIAAKQAGRTYIGIDISAEYCRKAEERIKELGQTSLTI